jgi:mono/diheme cytochrome c family protein
LLDFGVSIMQRFNAAKSLMGLALVALLSTTAFAEEPQDAANQEARKIFANSCSWCHGMFGMKAGKGGPKLAGTSLDETGVYNTIIKGQGAMPSFKNTLKDEEVKMLAKYIKSLPSE